MNENFNKVVASLDTIRKFLQEDGGDVELVSVSDEGQVLVKLLGSCEGCPMSIMTLRAGIERSLMREHPFIKRVEALNFK